MSEIKPFKCPYAGSTVWCERRSNVDEDKMACDSCPVLWGEYWE